MVDALGDIDVQSGVRPLQFDLLQQNSLMQLLFQPPPAILGAVGGVLPLLVEGRGCFLVGDESQDLVPLVGAREEVLLLQ